MRFHARDHANLQQLANGEGLGSDPRRAGPGRDPTAAGGWPGPARGGHSLDQVAGISAPPKRLIAVVPRVPHEGLPGARDGALHDVDGLLGRRGLDMSGASARNSRSTRSGAARWLRSTRVVRVPWRRLTPTKPDSRISRATRLRPTWQPPATSSACTRGIPYVPCESSWMRRIIALNSSSRRARFDAPRPCHAQYPLEETPSTRHIVAT